MDQWQPVTDLVERDVHAPRLLVGGERVDLHRMGVDRDGGDSLDRREVLQMTSKGRFVDLEPGIEGKKAGRYHPAGFEGHPYRHSHSPCSWAGNTTA